MFLIPYARCSAVGPAGLAAAEDRLRQQIQVWSLRDIWPVRTTERPLYGDIRDGFVVAEWPAGRACYVPVFRGRLVDSESAVRLDGAFTPRIDGVGAVVAAGVVALGVGLSSDVWFLWLAAVPAVHIASWAYFRWSVRRAWERIGGAVRASPRTQRHQEPTE
jgi:hypothetical protein